MSQKTYRPMRALLLAGALLFAAGSADPASAEPYSSKVALTCDATPLCHASGPKVAIGQQLTIQFASCFVEILYAGPEIGLAFLGVDAVYGTGAKFRHSLDFKQHAYFGENIFVASQPVLFTIPAGHRWAIAITLTPYPPGAAECSLSGELTSVP